MAVGDSVFAPPGVDPQAGNPPPPPPQAESAVNRTMQGEAWRREVEAARRRTKMTEGAYRQLDEARRRQQQSLAAQAAARGANPFAQQQAAYQTGQMGSDTERLKAQLAQMEKMQISGLEVGALGRGADYEVAQQQMENEYLQALYQQEADQAKLDAGYEAMDDEWTGKVIGGAFSVASDERKKNLKPTDQAQVDALVSQLHAEDQKTLGQLRGTPEDPYAGEVNRIAADLRREDEKTLAKLKPQAFEYKPGEGPPGDRIGVTAQQLEKTPLGRSVVVNTPQGKMVDTGQATMQQYGLIGRLGKRVEDLESRLAKQGPQQREPLGPFQSSGGDERSFHAAAQGASFPRVAYRPGASEPLDVELPRVRSYVGPGINQTTPSSYSNPRLGPLDVTRNSYDMPLQSSGLGASAARIGRGASRVESLPDEELLALARSLGVNYGGP